MRVISPPKISADSSSKPTSIAFLKLPIKEMAKTPKKRQIRKIQNLERSPLRSFAAIRRNGLTIKNVPYISTVTPLVNSTTRSHFFANVVEWVTITKLLLYSFAKLKRRSITLNPVA